MAWRVDSLDAYDAWMKRGLRSHNEKAHLCAVLDGWERVGPPNPMETYGVNQVTLGPHLERITYRVFETVEGDEWEGIILVLVIG